MSQVSNVTHKVGPGGLFGNAALCGATTETHDLRLTSVDASVTCIVCASLEDVPDDTSNVAVPPSEVICPIEGHDHLMSECHGEIAPRPVDPKPLSSLFGMEWPEIWLHADHDFAICPACRSVVERDVWQGGNSLWDHWRTVHPDYRAE